MRSNQVSLTRVRAIVRIAALFAGFIVLGGCQSPRRSTPKPVAADPVQGAAIVDLTHPFDDQTIYWPTGQRFAHTPDSVGMQPGGYYYEAYSFCAAEHGGTHLDAPLHFPGLDPDAARWLVAERQIHAIGLDTPSIDAGPSTAFLAHRILLDANVPVFENVAELERLPARGFTVVALPMKIGGGSGGP